MTGPEKIYRRVLRRETHASRTVTATVVAVLVIIAALAVLLGIVWWALDDAFRERVLAQVDAVSDGAFASSTLITFGVIALVVAVGLVLLALLPGRLARRARITSRTALLVDDGVLADAIADAVAGDEHIAREQVSVTIGRRHAFVRVTPPSGVAVDAARIARAADRAIAELGFSSTARVDIAEHGVVA